MVVLFVCALVEDCKAYCHPAFGLGWDTVPERKGIGLLCVESTLGSYFGMERARSFAVNFPMSGLTRDASIILSWERKLV